MESDVRAKLHKKCKVPPKQDLFKVIINTEFGAGYTSTRDLLCMQADEEPPTKKIKTSPETSKDNVRHSYSMQMKNPMV